jgi:prophage antirepressor-like protein
MNNTLSINFTFNESQVRTLSEGEVIWFVAKDVATILGHANPERAIRKYVDEEDRGVTELVTPGGIQNVTIISEYGVYSLILSSHTEEAKKFKHWVTHEVLPSIRKQGFYSVLPDQELIDLLVKRQSENPTFLREAAVDLKSKKALEQLAQDAQLRELWKQRAELPLGEYKSRLDVICNGNFTLLNKETKKYEKWYTAFKARKVDYSL